MKSLTIKSLVASLAVALCGIPAGAYAGPSGSSKGTDCTSIGADLRKAVAANPSQVLVYVEDSMIANGACACEIVKAAILGAGAQSGTAEANALVKQIVYAAITVNPSMSAVIVECAMAVAPRASDEIQAALAEALGDGKGGSGLGGADYGGIAGFGGMYLIPPVASGGVLIQQVFQEADEKVRVERETIIEREVVIEREVIIVPRTPDRPISPSSAH